MIHDGEEGAIRNELRRLATEIESVSQPAKHHSRAAQAMRDHASGMINVPWGAYQVDLQDHGRTLYLLAVALWKCNPARDSQWHARFTRVFLEVWATEDPRLDTQVRPSVSRLQSWMLEHGINLKITVNSRENRLVAKRDGAWRIKKSDSVDRRVADERLRGFLVAGDVRWDVPRSQLLGDWEAGPCNPPIIGGVACGSRIRLGNAKLNFIIGLATPATAKTPIWRICGSSTMIRPCTSVAR